MNFPKKTVSVILMFFLLIAAAVPAFAAGKPEALISSGSCAVGETVAVTISLKNAVNLTSGDLNVQYNPNILRFVKAQESAAMKADKDITLMFSEPSPADGLDENKEQIHAFYVTFFHLEKFTQSLNNCDLITLTFEAVGSGECPLVLAASSFFINEEETPPVLSSGMITVSGGAGDAVSWDYGANADPDIVYTDPSYTFATSPQKTVAEKSTNMKSTATPSKSNNTDASSTTSPAKVVGIIVAVVVIVGAVAVIAIYSGKKKNIVED